MDNIFSRSRLQLAIPFLIVALSVMFVTVSAFAAPGNGKGPKCKYRDLDSNKIISYNCDRFQSKGDIDSVTPQIKIISPVQDEEVDYSALVDSNGNGSVELPITIVISPDSDYTVDFTAASNAGTEYAFVPQIDGLGHAHAYIAPEIGVAFDEEGNVESVNFVGSDNRSDLVGGFCVFQAPQVQTPEFQVITANCELFQGEQPIQNNGNYRVIVDTTENSHGPRLKHSPRDVPSGDIVVVKFVNVP